MELESFRRALRFARPRYGAAVAWPTAVLASLLFAALLVLLGLFLDLIIYGGAVEVEASQGDDLRAIAGEPDRYQAGSAVYEDRGLLPLVWRKTDTWHGGMWRALYGGLPALRDNMLCLVALVIAGMAIASLRALVLYWQHRSAAGAALSVTTALRRALHRQAFQVGSTNLSDGAGPAVKLFVPDVQAVRAGVLAWYGPVLREPVKLAVLLVLALAIQIWLTLAAVLLACLGWFLFQRLGERWRLAARAAGEQSARELALLVEGLRQMRLVRGYLMQESEEQQFEHHLEAYRQNELRRMRGEQILGPAIGFFVLAAALLVLFLVGLNSLQGAGLGLPSMIVLVATLTCAYWPVMELFRAAPVVAAAGRAAGRILVYLHRALQIPQAVGVRFLDPMREHLAFDGVSLRGAAGRDLLDRVSFQVRAGTKLAVLSLNPDEPRALAYLLARFLDPHEGEIRIDGQPLTAVTLESLRAQVSLVMQDELLFTGTVAENISCGDRAYNLSQISDAAKLAHAHQFIQGLPQGYETVVGDHGLNLTASQKFRIGLARAALRDPAIVVIEEPSEPLDADTKALVDDTLDRLCPGRTALFLPERNSTLRRADAVLVLHQGKVAAYGEHRELVQSNDLYRHVQYERFNEFRQGAPLVP